MCLVSGDSYYLICSGEQGTLRLDVSERGRVEPLFATNDKRAFAVQLAFALLNGSNFYYPGRSPYEDVPAGFALQQRTEVDEYGYDSLVVRFAWGDGCWAEMFGSTSLLNGLRWAWMFVASDKTIENALALHDGFPLFRSSPPPAPDLPPGSHSNLSLEQLSAGRAERET